MLRAVLLAVSVSALTAVGLAAGTGSAFAQAAEPPAKKAQPKRTKAQKADPEKQDPADALRQLQAGQAALTAGKADVAVQHLTGALSGRGLNDQDLAKAMYLRGAAYRKLQKPALAIADLNGALYIKKGLADADRRDADEQRAAAYREAGLPDQRSVTAAAAPATPTAAAPSTAAPAATAKSAAPATAAVTPAPAAAPSPAAVQPAAPAQPASGTTAVGRFFGSIFGGSSSAAPAPPPAAPAPPVQPATTSWSTQARVPTTAAVTSATAQGPVTVQVANVRSRDEAERIAAKVRQQNGTDLGARPVDVVENIAGSFGRLYAVRVGPFASADESRSLCAKFRAQGLDCLSIAAQ